MQHTMHSLTFVDKGVATSMPKVQPARRFHSVLDKCNERSASVWACAAETLQSRAVQMDGRMHRFAQKLALDRRCEEDGTHSHGVASC